MAIYSVLCPVFVESGEINVTSPFQPARVDPIDGQVKRHDGVDLTRWIGYSTLATICSFADGVVSKVGYDSSRGYNVSISHGNGWVSMYFHLAEGSFRVKTGQKVKARTSIGYMGNTGHSAGAHLHFQLEKNGVPVDGLPYLLKEKEMDTMNQEQFDAMFEVAMDRYLAKKAKEQPSEWALDDLKWAVTRGIMNGDEQGNLMARSPVTREQDMAFHHRLYKLILEEVLR